MRENHTMQTIKGLDTIMKSFSIGNGLRKAAMLLLFAIPLAAAGAEQKTFATPEAAVEALVAALKSNNESALIEIFGEKHKDLVATGNPAADAAERASAAEKLATFNALDERGNDRRVLLLGEQAWPFPVPLVRQGGAWRYATEEGVEEVLNRRIGANERNAIDVLYAFVDAQRVYASRDRNGDGVLQYAQRLASAPGKYDGLYWPADPARGEEESPFGPLIAASSAYGYKKGDPYRGYHFRLLTRQGKGAPGGAYNYVINGRMIAGFAMVAYPADYGKSGVMTFIVNQYGKVYQRDLGKRTAEIGAKLNVFDPAGWTDAEQ